MRARSILRACLVLMALTAFHTWPHAGHPGAAVVDHHDPYFSIWRLSWIGHALRTQPTELFNANIYHPELRALAYSDATLLEGLIAAPFLWAGVSPVSVYTLLLLIGFSASGLAMYLLAFEVTRDDDASLVAASIFVLVPYRIEHIMHLEMQWAMWIPLTLWALHRTVQAPSWTRGLLCGLFLALQFLSCVYYGVFLAAVTPLVGLALFAAEPSRLRPALPPLIAGAILAAVVTGIYAWPYLENAHVLGPRSLDEIALYSARPIHYLTSPDTSWLWGWTADLFGSQELRLYPGVLATGLAVVALATGAGATTWTYAAVAALAVELSFGVNGWLFPWLVARAPQLQGLRAAARISIVGYCALSVLAATGFERLRERLRLPRHAWLVAVGIGLLVDYGVTRPRMVPIPGDVPDVYRFIGQLPSGVLAEFPMPEPDSLPGHDATYEFWSTTHWRPLVNGYSGYASTRFVNMLERMLDFPSDDSIAELQTLHVRYVIVHEAHYRPREFVDLALRIGQRPEFEALGRFRDGDSWARLFRLQARDAPR